jgi:hypothetical protein
MLENLTTFARIRITLLSVTFIASLTMFVTGPPELHRAEADNSAIPNPGGSDCPEGTFCAKPDGFQAACTTNDCCGGANCQGQWYSSLKQKQKRKSDSSGYCWKRKDEPTQNACLNGDCEPEGADCLEGTCEAINPSGTPIWEYQCVAKCDVNAL